MYIMRKTECVGVLGAWPTHTHTRAHTHTHTHCTRNKLQGQRQGVSTTGIHVHTHECELLESSITMWSDLKIKNGVLGRASLSVMYM